MRNNDIGICRTGCERALRSASWYSYVMERTFPVVLVPQPEGGFFVECPSLPGCYSEGDTFEEALDNIREAILLTIEDMQELGQPIPKAPPPLVTEVRVPA